MSGIFKNWIPGIEKMDTRVPREVLMPDPTNLPNLSVLLIGLRPVGRSSDWSSPHGAARVGYF